MPKILLNDLLGLRDGELDRSVIKFNQWNGTNDPMEEYTKNPSTVNDGWFLWHKERRYFREGQIGICFLKLSSDTWLLTTIKEITKCLDVVDFVPKGNTEPASYDIYRDIRCLFY